MAAMRQWYQNHPHLFDKQPHDLPGLDTYFFLKIKDAFPGKVR